MAERDFYLSAAETRLNELEAERQRVMADLAQAKADSDWNTAPALIEQLSHIEVAKANVLNLANGYVQAQQPPQQMRPSREEWQARPIDRMSPDDGLEVARQSKYGRDLSWNSPGVAAGWHEAQRRKARGE